MDEERTIVMVKKRTDEIRTVLQLEPLGAWFIAPGVLLRGLAVRDV